MQTAKDRLAETNQVIQAIEKKIAELNGSLPKLVGIRDKCQKVIKGLEEDSSDDEDSSEGEEDPNRGN